MSGTIYLVGYSLYAMVVKSLMSDHRRLLIDTRYKPVSSIAGWNETQLKSIYGERYRPAGAFLGNVNHDKEGADIKIANIKTGIYGLQKYLDKGHDLVLICGCRNYHTCHLAVIRQAIQKDVPSARVLVAGHDPMPGFIGALSLSQPFADWVMNPQLFESIGLPPKLIENRDWTTGYRGPLLIHASKTFESRALEYWSQKLGDTDRMKIVFSRQNYNYPAGQILGSVELVDAVAKSDDIWHVAGQHAFILERPERFPSGIFWRGSPGIFYVALDVIQRLKAA